MKSSSRSRAPSRLSDSVMAFLVVLVLTALTQAQTFATLYNFTGGSDGAGPNAVIRDPASNLYGTTYEGGDLNCGWHSHGCGVVFKLNSVGTETVLHTFSGSSDGVYPSLAPLVRDSKGNIYGTTFGGG
jgi:uncharacterized repeat protein (TIGR03803 family)